MRTVTWIACAAVVVLFAGVAQAGSELEKGVALKAGDKDISVGVGHAAPWVHDWDGDGLQDLLVGQMGKGQLRIYRNVGTKTAPRFQDFEIFKVGEAEGTVPTG